MTLFEELKRRNLIAQTTHEKEIEELLNNEKVTFYIGFDATADSLHVGHFMQITIMKRFQDAGHRPIALLGTGTTMIGDPTGKSDMRKMLTEEEIDYNAECFRKQISKFIDFSDDKALVMRNGDWLKNMNYIQFLRDVGVFFSVNKMLTADCVKTRLEKGLTFLEFNYMLMQSYDFLYLYEKEGCKLELGGNDQWSNILGGVDLVRRVHNGQAFGLTFNLLTNKEGNKMGKTENGAVWLDPEKMTPYDFFQYWRNVDDADVINCMKWLTFIPIEEIEEYEKLDGSELNTIKEKLAYELTKMVHGEDEANKVLAAAKQIFLNGGVSEDMPTTEISEEDFVEGEIGLLTLLVKSGLTPSNAEARRNVQGNGISVNDVKETDPTAKYTKTDFKENMIIKKGKKIFHKIVLK